MATEIKENTQHSGGMHTFIFGIVIGVAITLLFTTKKGRRLLRSLTDEGMERVTKWEDLVSKKIDEKIESISDDIEESILVEEEQEQFSDSQSTDDDAPVQASTSEVKKPTKNIDLEIEVKPARNASGTEAGEEVSPVRHSVRRFFKSAKKK